MESLLADKKDGQEEMKAETRANHANRDANGRRNKDK
jgi:hypothetical protein